MVLVKVRLDRQFDEFQRNVRRWTDELFTLRGPVFSSARSSWMPESDIYETEDHIYLIVNVAGVAKENMEVDFCNNVVRVAGVRSTMLPPGIPAQYHQLEMGQGDFERFFRIPAAVDDEDIEAVHGDGLLSIRMKKARRSRSVEVK